MAEHISRVHAGNYGVYGVRKVWRRLHGEGIEVACCVVARLMRELGLDGARRGKTIRTTVRDDGHERAADQPGGSAPALRHDPARFADRRSARSTGPCGASTPGIQRRPSGDPTAGP
ncbi:hypothetical protein GCM10010140_61350 [Streptosporangium pseudovulgare]|uniref:HTH-like domain-containing protein n=1 Tax=Streptosporangium pseudovulgare TaxID=35765 RepID=A0ABQ2RBI4_9ACTN|nr:hypothetical protein GCM10010140_61350 [Streptosporangium pseudovulgare]